VVKKRIEQAKQVAASVKAAQDVPEEPASPAASPAPEQTTAMPEPAKPGSAVPTLSSKEPAGKPESPEAKAGPESTDTLQASAATQPVKPEPTVPSEAPASKTESPGAKTEEAVSTGGAAGAPALSGTQPAGSLRDTFSTVPPRYSAEGKIDPFLPLFSEGTESGAGEDQPKRELTPLEKIDLSQLRLVAILRARSGNRAMVEDATGKGYILSSGIYVGMSSGKVTEILEDRVVVEEETKDIFGKAGITKKELKIQKPSGEE